MIKAVIFDLGGVLLDLDMPKCIENITSLGVDMEASGNGSMSDLMKQYEIGRVSTEEIIGSIQKLGNPRVSYGQALDAWNSCLLSIPQYKLEFIKELKAEGYHTYLLSNTNDAHWKYIMENCFPEPVCIYFNRTFLSHEIHVAKPNESAYRTVLEQISTPAEQCLFIDDLKVNCEAAQALGIQTYNVPVRTDFREEVTRYIRQH